MNSVEAIDDVRLVNPHNKLRYAQLPKCLLRRGLDFPTIVLYAILVDHAGENGKCFPKVATLASEMGLGESTIRKHLTILKTHGLIVAKQQGMMRPNSYTFVLHPWIAECYAGVDHDCYKRSVLPATSGAGDRHELSGITTEDNYSSLSTQEVTTEWDSEVQEEAGTAEKLRNTELENEIRDLILEEIHEYPHFVVLLERGRNVDDRKLRIEIESLMTQVGKKYQWFTYSFFSDWRAFNLVTEIIASESPLESIVRWLAGPRTLTP